MSSLNFKLNISVESCHCNQFNNRSEQTGYNYNQLYQSTLIFTLKIYIQTYFKVLI